MIDMDMHIVFMMEKIQCCTNFKDLIIVIVSNKVLLSLLSIVCTVVMVISSDQTIGQKIIK